MNEVCASVVEIARNKFAGVLQSDSSSSIEGSLVTWLGVINRCFNSSLPNFKHYGGRGIVVCERWFVFANFYADMGPRPDGMSLDRIDNNGIYEKENCRWASPTEQARNTRRNVQVNGMFQTDAAKFAGVAESTIYRRLKNGYSQEDALNSDLIKKVKFSLNDVQQIRKMLSDGVPKREIEKIWSISRTALNNIHKGRAWK